MSDHVETDGVETAKAIPDETDSVEAYETEDGTVLYDADNPLAWIESTRTISLDEAS
jgi:hypothetical protein